MKDITEDEIIFAFRMVAMGATWEEVVRKIYGEVEMPELLVELTRERVRHWYRRQSPQTLQTLLALR